MMPARKDRKDKKKTFHKKSTFVPPVPKIVYSLQLNEVCNILKASASTVRRWEEEGKITSQRNSLGRRIFNLAEVKKFATTLKNERESHKFQLEQKRQKRIKNAIVAKSTIPSTYAPPVLAVAKKRPSTVFGLRNFVFATLVGAITLFVFYYLGSRPATINQVIPEIPEVFDNGETKGPYTAGGVEQTQNIGDIVGVKVSKTGEVYFYEDVEALKKITAESLKVTQDVEINHDLAIGGMLWVTGDSFFRRNVDIQDDLIIGNDIDTDTLYLNARVADDILPKTTDLYSLGSPTFEFQNLYIGGVAHIDNLTVDESQTVTNDLTVGGNATIAGNVGIGTTSPTVALDVIGAGKFSTNLTASTGNITLANISGNTTIGNATGTLTLHGATTLDNTFTVSGSNLTSLGGNLTVTGTAWTATPTISGLITATNGLTANGTVTVNSNFVQTAAVNNSFAGNVGIGTTGPTALFSVGAASPFTVTDAGLVTTSGGATITGTANINATGTSATNIGNSTGVLTLASGGASGWTNTSGNLTLATATTGNILLNSIGNVGIGGTAPSTAPYVFVGSTGNVGIGTTNPTALLDVNGTLKAITVNGNTITTGTGTLTLGAGKTLTANNSLTLAGTDSTTITFQGTDTYVGRTTSDTLTNKTLTDSTNVLGGVTMTLGSDATGDIYYRGATGVLTKLAIGGANTVLHGGTTPSYSAIGAADITADSLDWSEFKDAMQLDASTTIDLNSKNLSFWNTGNMGIGTTNPLVKLHVVGDGTNAAAFMSGNVGIGITSPTVALDVVGAGKFSTDLTVGGDLAVNGATSADITTATT
ncbi:MerR family transcriptional regulator, partial [Patescibacteria group bacterium]|nr:MerR family transcriptional regulator [Patescibacteria group bacterium]